MQKSAAENAKAISRPRWNVHAGENAAETEGFDAVVATKMACWLPDDMAFKGVDDQIDTSSLPSTSDIDPAEDDREIARDVEAIARDALHPRD